MDTVVASLRARLSTQPHLWRALILDSIAGLIFLLINFPNLLERVIPISVGYEGVHSVLLELVRGTQRAIAKGALRNNFRF